MNENKRRSISLWFRSLRRSSKVILVVALIASIAIVAYAAGLIWNSVTSSTNLTKAKFIEVSLTGSTASGSIKPGAPVALAPVLTNNGDINATAIIRVTVPLVNGSPAYEYSVNSSWTLIEADEAAGEYVYGYGTSDELSIVAPGGSTDPLVEKGFTMRSDITGAEFNGMSDVNINIAGYMIDASEDSEAGTDPGTVWGMIQ